ncbi:polysaccharide pyruvyl transferase family protein [Bariatricus sp. SGI.154]|uniref:polysaccharide pyruvyl transferase family protein n=1 Tax=Bariatricus sp. SGI.154 TaxID=3420549 RepID=UPI003D08E048
MKIGILTHYNVNNQGAQLQMLAMKYYLEDMGHQVCILTYEKNFDFDQSEASKNSMSLRNFPYYVKNYLIEKGIGLTLFNTRKVLAHKRSWKELEFQPYNHNDCDIIIIGSDEVYSIDVGCNKMMYGYNLNKPAIAYAPAFGRTTEEVLKKFNCYDMVKSGLSSMYRLSARDTHTREMIYNMTGQQVPLVSDPVLLYDGHEFITSVKPIKKKYLLVYSYDRNMVDKDEVRNIKRYAKKHGLITVSLGTYHKWCDKNIVCNAREWYSYFQDAECVVTDTFHGTVVAIKNHCNVAVFIRESINAFKLQSLLEETGLQKRRLKCLTAKNLEYVLSQTIDYKEVDAKIDVLLTVSRRYLEEALEKI